MNNNMTNGGIQVSTVDTQTESVESKPFSAEVIAPICHLYFKGNTFE